MQIFCRADGHISALYDETIDLASLGNLAITRASHLESDGRGQWYADLAPSGGPLLGPFARRSHALAAEEAWIVLHRLACSPAR